MEALPIIYQVQQPIVTDLYTFFTGNKHIVCTQASMNTILSRKELTVMEVYSKKGTVTNILLYFFQKF